DELRDLVPELRPNIFDIRLGVFDDVVEERRRDRLLVQPQLRADPRHAYGMLDERRSGAPLLAFVRRRGVPERSRDELAVDRASGVGDLGEQLVEKPLMLLTCLERRHGLSVLRAF